MGSTACYLCPWLYTLFAQAVKDVQPLLAELKEEGYLKNAANPCLWFMAPDDPKAKAQKLSQEPKDKVQV